MSARVCTLLSCLVLVGGFQGSTADAMEFRPFIGLAGGVNWHEMTDLSSGNQLKKSNLLGVLAGGQLTPRHHVGVAYEQYFVDSRMRLFDGEIRTDLPSRVVRGYFEFQPKQGSIGKSGRDRYSIGVGVSVGALWLDGETALIVDNQVEAVPISGTATVAEGYVVVELQTGDHFALVPTLGLRSARVDNPESNGEPFQDSGGRTLSVDYSGFFARVAGKWTF